MFTVVDDDIFNSTETYLCHQTNCVTNGGAGIAAAIFDRYPYSDIYSEREKPDVPGSIIIRGDIGQRLVVNMMGQFYPGPALFYYDGDRYEDRLLYFRKCLFEMTKLKGSFAFPWTIGCGIAGGDWGKYIGVLKSFEKYINGDIVIYRLPA